MTFKQFSPFNVNVFFILVKWDIKCKQCGMTFTNLQDKEEHMKLEYKEGKRPTGVSQLG
jgi:hypothetical protein